VLLLGLRWRIFFNSLRQRKRQTELALGAISYVFGGLFVIGASLGIFFGTGLMLRENKVHVLDMALWGIFLFWQLIPLMVEGYSPGLSFREVARYPISFRLYFLLNVAYGLFDPAAMASLLWLFSMWLGILWARPEWALPAAGLFVLFAACNVMCNRVLMAVFERFQSTRRGRERMVAVLLLLMLLPQLANFAAQGWIRVRFKPPPWLVDWALRLHHVSPPGLFVRALIPGHSSQLLAVLLLAAYVLLLAWLQARQLRSAYLGETYSDRYVPNREMEVRPGWRLAGIDDKVTAIVEKEIRYLRQNARLIVMLIYPMVLLAFMLLGGTGKRVFSLAHGGNLLGALAGFLALSVPNLSYNIFGMDREAFGRWMLFPIPLQKVMRAKNVAQGALLFAIYLLGALALVAIGNVSVLTLIAVTAAFLSLLIVQLGAGSLLSVYWPKRIDMTQVNSRMASSAAGFASLLVTLPMAGVTGIVILATWYWNLPWLPLVAGLAGLAVSLRLYSYLLNKAAAYAQDHLEEIATELGV
jgi:hypothetical protein